MKRKRRTAAQAKFEILQTAESIVLNDGPSALTLKNIATQLKISHPAILHHFDSMQQLIIELQQSMSRSLRDSFLEEIGENPSSRFGVIDEVLSRISDPRNGRVIAYLLSSGIDPFPDQEEKGLESIMISLLSGRNYPEGELRRVIHLAVLTMYAEGMFGDLLRERFENAPDQTEFRHWMLGMLAKHLEGFGSSKTLKDNVGKGLHS